MVNKFLYVCSAQGTMSGQQTAQLLSMHMLKYFVCVMMEEAVFSPRLHVEAKKYKYLVHYAAWV